MFPLFTAAEGDHNSRTSRIALPPAPSEQEQDQEHSKVVPSVKREESKESKSKARGGFSLADFLWARSLNKKTVRSSGEPVEYDESEEYKRSLNRALDGIRME